ncbi:Aminopeptidase [Acetobacter malorum]|uniref:Aminopeptidase n=1 Tax=Acetobacter malorum TaxID=178901 RepID=A0A177G959_9PROT|nr:M20/M25/M40 family metallo-hydrolase [Acetobacter malorum]OAG76341.1 Aminopeptidase [Acetobacter malorum]
MPVEVSHLESQNVLGKLTGSKHPDETVMFGAHWDAFGMSKNAQGHEVIRHGAIDDGSGVAGVLEIARAFKAGPQPERTVMFASWTAEERGLLGSAWYAAHPMAPLEKTAANFTMDVLQMAGPSHNVFMVGAGQDTVQDDVAAAAEKQGRVMLPEAMPERGAFLSCRPSAVCPRWCAGSSAHGYGGLSRSAERRCGCRAEMVAGLYGLLPSGL